MASDRLTWRPHRGQADCFEGFAGLHWYRVSRSGEHWYWFSIAWVSQSPGIKARVDLQSRPYLDREAAIAGAQRHFEAQP